MKILCLDPGPLMTGLCIYDTDTRLGSKASEIKNESLLRAIVEKKVKADALASEDIVSYGMHVGNETLDTCKWIGRFQQAWVDHYSEFAVLICRKDVTEMVCDSRTANDTAVYAALTHIYGGSRDIARGTKKAPGPLFTFSTTHTRSALAVGVAVDRLLRTNLTLSDDLRQLSETVKKHAACLNAA